MEKLEQAKASVRAKIERPFHIVKNLFHHRKAHYRGLAKNTAQLMRLFGSGNLLMASWRLKSLHVQSTSKKVENAQKTAHFRRDLPSFMHFYVLGRITLGTRSGK